MNPLIIGAIVVAAFVLLGGSGPKGPTTVTVSGVTFHATPPQPGTDGAVHLGSGVVVHEGTATVSGIKAAMLSASSSGGVPHGIDLIVGKSKPVTVADEEIVANPQNMSPTDIDALREGSLGVDGGTLYPRNDDGTVNLAWLIAVSTVIQNLPYDPAKDLTDSGLFQWFTSNYTSTPVKDGPTGGAFYLTKPHKYSDSDQAFRAWVGAWTYALGKARNIVGSVKAGLTEVSAHPTGIKAIPIIGGVAQAIDAIDSTPEFAIASKYAAGTIGV